MTMLCIPDFSVFKKAYDEEKTQLLCHWMSADLETPVSAYLKICGHTPYSFLLESVEGGANLGRYSIIGTRPDLLWKCDKTHNVYTSTSDKPWRKLDIDAKKSLSDVIRDATLDVIPDDLPPMCQMGMFGYIGYDMVRLVEDIPDNNSDDLGIPDSVLMRPSVLAIFDNVKNMMCIATPVYDHAGHGNSTNEEAYERAVNRIKEITDALACTLDRKLLEHRTVSSTRQTAVSNMGKQDYENAVSRAVEYIHAGEIFQVVPSQRFTINYDLPSFELYRSLRSINPSPFLFHLSFEDFSLVGSSPEILVRVRDNVVTIRPIAGTRKRGKTSAEDRALADDLLSDEKELAEHLMLLDLGRNDVGRVAEIGSVRVTEQFQVEYYSHVMHIISNVEGDLKKGVSVIDALFAGFPAGTVSGAPKIRAMEIIDELEISRRASYAGGVGYFSNDTMDSCIALRTALIKDNKLHVQTGAGVVADSKPESEHQECCNKARAILYAAEMTIEKHSKTDP